jgi:hypothetical protein
VFPLSSRITETGVFTRLSSKLERSRGVRGEDFKIKLGILNLKSENIVLSSLSSKVRKYSIQSLASYL